MQLLAETHTIKMKSQDCVQRKAARIKADDYRKTINVAALLDRFELHTLQQRKEVQLLHSGLLRLVVDIDFLEIVNARN